LQQIVKEIYVLEGSLKNENELLRSVNHRFQEEIKQLKESHKKFEKLAKNGLEEPIYSGK